MRNGVSRPVRKLRRIGIPCARKRRPARTDLFGQSIRSGHLGDELTRDSDVVEYERNFDSVGRTHVSASLGRFPIEAIDEGRGTRLHDLTFGELPSISRARMIGRNENV